MTLHLILISVIHYVPQLFAAVSGVSAVGVGLAAFTGVGAGIGMGIATGKACEAVSRQPEATGKIRALLLLGLAFAETTALYGMLIAFLIMF